MAVMIADGNIIGRWNDLHNASVESLADMRENTKVRAKLITSPREDKSQYKTRKRLRSYLATLEGFLSRIRPESTKTISASAAWIAKVIMCSD